MEDMSQTLRSPAAHLGSSAGRHSTEWYRSFTATSHSRSTADVLSTLWSVATLRAQCPSERLRGPEGRSPSSATGLHILLLPAPQTGQGVPQFPHWEQAAVCWAPSECGLGC
jgi:hypothetical protein